MSKVQNDNTRISGKNLKKALEKLKPTLGEQTIITIIEELELMYGIILVGSLSYSYLEFKAALAKVLGESASQLVLEVMTPFLEE
jgi:hypothetical protein